MRKSLTGLMLAILCGVSQLAGCGGGGGGGGGDVVTPPTSGEMFLMVSTPLSSTAISPTRNFVISGVTLPGATVLVNGAATGVSASGLFSSTVVLSQTNPTAIQVQSSGGGTTLTANRTVYYQDMTKCALVYVATDPESGYDKIYDVDPSIPNSNRIISGSSFGVSDGDPDISPDGTQVAFVRTSGTSVSVQRVACSGGAATTVASGGGYYRTPQWSPDGTGIAYAYNGAGNYEIYTVPSSGGAATQITNHTAADEYPTWSPDGTKLLFSSNRSTSGGATTSSTSNLWTVTVSPAVGAAALTYNPIGAGAPTCAAGSGACSAKMPSWGANGLIAFVLQDVCGTTGNSQSPPQSACTNILLYNPIAAAFTSVSTGTKHYIAPNWNAALGYLLFSEQVASGEPSVYRTTVTINGSAVTLGVVMQTSISGRSPN